MKKIPTLFERVYDGHKIISILSQVIYGMEWVFAGEGTATVKIDGSCCAVIGGEFYKRYDAKKGRPIPEGAIKCQEEPDLVTGHMPCWVKCDRDNSSDKWFWAAYDSIEKAGGKPADGTYEAWGKHFQGNPYNCVYDTLSRHGQEVIEVERTFEGIKKYLSENYIEGIVFWKDGEPKCKIKRSDFGFEWNKR